MPAPTASFVPRFAQQHGQQAGAEHGGGEHDPGDLPGVAQPPPDDKEQNRPDPQAGVGFFQPALPPGQRRVSQQPPGALGLVKPCALHPGMDDVDPGRRQKRKEENPEPVCRHKPLQKRRQRERYHQQPRAARHPVGELPVNFLPTFGRILNGFWRVLFAEGFVLDTGRDEQHQRRPPPA